MIFGKQLTKIFGTFHAVDHLNIHVKSGEIYAFLGPNGAGKTTTIRMLTGSLSPTSGEIEICRLSYQHNELELKRIIGVVPDEPHMYENLRGREYIDFIKGIYRLDSTTTEKRFEEICSAFDIDFLQTYIGDYSHGMKQKLMVASVLMRHPKVIFLDEPTIGLDARSAKILKTLLEKYRNEGSAIFLTTHILEIAEKMSDRIGILKNGRMIAEGSLEELRKTAKNEQSTLEDIFLELTGGAEYGEAIDHL
jgi:ABC-2 type transport system ATP-binding protein